MLSWDLSKAQHHKDQPEPKNKPEPLSFASSASWVWASSLVSFVWVGTHFSMHATADMAYTSRGMAPGSITADRQTP